MNGEQQLALDLHAATLQGDADKLRAGLPALLELNEMVAQLTATKYLTLRNSGLTMKEAMYLCKA